MNFKIVDDNDRVILLFAVILQTAVASAEFVGKVFKYYHHESMKCESVMKNVTSVGDFPL